jgi:hypothetical protein
MSYDTVRYCTSYYSEYTRVREDPRCRKWTNDTDLKRVQPIVRSRLRTFDCVSMIILSPHHV